MSYESYEFIPGTFRGWKHGQNMRKQTSFGIWNVRCLEVKTWKCCLNHPEMASWHNKWHVNAADSFLDPVETLPHLHQSRHPHSIVMESQECSPYQWTLWAPTQPAQPTQPENRSLPGCKVCCILFCCSASKSQIHLNFREFNVSASVQCPPWPEIWNWNPHVHLEAKQPSAMSRFVTLWGNSGGPPGRKHCDIIVVPST